MVSLPTRLVKVAYIKDNIDSQVISDLEPLFTEVIVNARDLVSYLCGQAVIWEFVRSNRRPQSLDSLIMYGPDDPLDVVIPQLISSFRELASRVVDMKQSGELSYDSDYSAVNQASDLVRLSLVNLDSPPQRPFDPANN